MLAASRRRRGAGRADRDQGRHAHADGGGADNRDRDRCASPNDRAERRWERAARVAGRTTPAATAAQPASTATAAPSPTTQLSPSPTARPSATATAVAGSEIDRIVDALSLEEVGGQVILGQLPGQALDGETAALIRDLHLGGMLLFGYNIGSPEGTRALTAAIQAACGRPELPGIIAADQEGGPVQRLQTIGTIFPAAMALGATASADYARQWGVATARELRSVGINTNFAPVLDVNNNPANPVIGIRSFGERPDEVARLGTAAIGGLLDGGVLATGKHFPGHGDTAVDSHFGLPINANSLSRLQAVELVPFRAAISAKIPLIMSAHIIFQALDPDLPSTLSRTILTGLLREQLGFEGVIVSDAMTMQAIADEWGTVEGSVRFIAAGGDLVEPLRDERLVHAAILAAVRNGRIQQDQLKNSVRRIARAKVWLAGQGQANAAWLGAAEHRTLAANIARDAITLVRDAGQQLPLPRASRVAVVECVFQGRTSPVAEALKTHFGTVSGVVVNAQQPTTAEINAAVAAANGASVVVYATRGAQGYPGQVRLATTLAGTGKPVVAVALAEPYDAGAYPGVGTALATYGAEQVVLNALGAALAGEQPLRGRLPVTV
ncbi:MAG: beta-N-acetylhexosaminidase [Chloroflexia bacterium]